MNSNIIEIKGFHGTTRDSADSILDSKSFYMSDGEEEWLGKGVYFFEDDCQQAIDFCDKARKYDRWAVIECDINARIVINLVDTNTFRNFEKFAKNLKDKYKTLKDGKPRQLMNSVVLNTIYKLSPYDVVKGTFPVPSTNPAPRTNIMPMQVQVSVRNRQCIDINSIREVCNNGH